MTFRALAFRLALVACMGATALLAGCVPLVVGGAVAGGAMVAADRRSAGAQVDDETTELKIQNAASSNYKNVHLNATSYNGVLLLTGEAPDEATKDAIGNMARRMEHVRSVQNELVIGPPTSIGDRSNDSLITSKVKARFVEANQFYANAVKVVTERGVVYLMGIVTRQEADAAARLAAGTGGVVRVVRLFEYA